MNRYVIVGGVAGGATAAARLRRMDEESEIVMLERGAYVSFANCGLPYHIGEVIQERDALLVSTPEKLQAEFNIDVRTGSEVVSIDRKAHRVTVREVGSEDTYQLSYTKLVLSPGAKPFVPPIEGVDLHGVHTLRTIPDMDAIKMRVDAEQVQSAVVVGGGFIGLEMAENLMERGVTVSVIEMLPQVMAPLDIEIAAPIHRHLREKGVRLALGDGLQRIEQREDGRLDVVLASDKRVAADLVVMAIGVRPENTLAQSAGLEIGPRGHIVVDAQMRTSDPDIYAVGDAIQVINPVLGVPTAVPLAGPANRQARIAADHIVGRETAYKGTLGTSIVKVFDMTAACTGTNSRTLDQNDVAYLSSITHSHDHVSYYPGSSEQTIKVMYTPEGKLLGAQAVGRGGIDRTIDALAVAIQADMTVYDLEHLELAYAPPYGAAKDPVNVAGYVAANRLRGDSALVNWRTVVEAQNDERVGLLDVRTQPEYDLGHIPGALHIENHELRDRLDELSSDKDWIVYCSVGRRAYVMERVLRQRGYRVSNLTGGWTTYDVVTEKQDNFDTWLDPNAGEHVAVPTSKTTSAVAVGEQVGADMQLNAIGMQCPGPILAVYKRVQTMEEGQTLKVTASDPGFGRDVSAWCERTGNALLDVSQENGMVRALIRKGKEQPQIMVSENGVLPAAKTMVVFSGDLDRALASFIIANGAAAMGQQVTMFFTFWGLNILRKRQSPRVSKNLIERMFGLMLPKGADALKLSQLHMGGMGTRIMKGLMKAKNIDSLPQLMASAQENGVKIIACQMSMDMMGIKAEELIDGVEIGGVATYIGETDKANASLFI